MKFCPECNNMYYLKLSDQESEALVLYCRACGTEDKNSNDETFRLKTLTSGKDQSYTLRINKYTKYDPTLPRTTYIKCPNQECQSKSKCKEGDDACKDEIIYLKTNPETLSYTYVCTKCDTVWESQNVK